AGGGRGGWSGAPLEPVVGYAGAVRSGNLIPVGGTVGMNADRTYPRTAAEQTRRALAIIAGAIEALGGRLEHVVRTRIFVTDIDMLEEIGRVHGAMFGAIRPATSMVAASRLVGESVVEIEADAVIPC